MELPIGTLQDCCRIRVRRNLSGRRFLPFLMAAKMFELSKIALKYLIYNYLHFFIFTFPWAFCLIVNWSSICNRELLHFQPWPKNLRWLRGKELALKIGVPIVTVCNPRASAFLYRELAFAFYE